MTAVTLATRSGAVRTRHSWTTGGLAKVSMTAAGLWFSQRTPRPTTRGCAPTIRKKPSGCGLTTSTSSVSSTVACKLFPVSYDFCSFNVLRLYLNWIFADRLIRPIIQVGGYKHTFIPACRSYYQRVIITFFHGLATELKQTHERLSFYY